MREVQTIINTTPNKVQSPTRNPPRSVEPGTWKPFHANSIIRPHDLSYKFRRAGPPPSSKWPEVGPLPAKARYHDVFYQLDMDPLSQASNPAILAEFMSEMGKIIGRPRTGLTMKSQRRLGKAIRRAKMMGVIPILSAPKPQHR
ncbi:hypothetical protein AX15_002343 [Amanita polypyramis BW_CC]|nr:hypothetical protein AX15_002343 [Amanita polypyramis BW_CC]